ncbi:hypothetical protein PybrP1_004309 [[Pythium] brassicae (nom. inval.)]|nr:hypothetical protein PybrP1_004309 [[Pythium] brassicae (nom. inval.)]
MASSDRERGSETALLGVISFGRGCGAEFLPDVYANVSAEFDFITSVAPDATWTTPSDDPSIATTGGGDGVTVADPSAHTTYEFELPGKLSPSVCAAVAAFLAGEHSQISFLSVESLLARVFNLRQRAGSRDWSERMAAAVRLEGAVLKRNAGFLRPWRSRPAHVTDDGFLRYWKKAGSSTKTKEVDLVKSDISQDVVQSHGYFCFEVRSGARSFALGFADRADAATWLEVLREVADENAAGRRAWVANLRRVLSLSLVERKELVKAMSDRDWVNEWMFCLRSLQNKEMSVAARRRRLKRLYSVVAEVYFARVQDREPRDRSASEADDLRSGSSSTSSSTGLSAASASTSTAERREPAAPVDDVDELRLQTLRVQFGSRSWRGRKRLAREVEQLARFRVVLGFVAAEKAVDRSVLARLPAVPLLAAFAIRGVPIVATAEPLRDRSAVAPIDKRDLLELAQALRLAKLLRAFPLGELPTLAARRIPGNAEATLAGVRSRFDDVLLHSLRSSMAHGVLIRADASCELELLSAHDMRELVRDSDAQWVPFLDLVYYQLPTTTTTTTTTTTNNWRATAFLLKAPDAVVTGDVVVSFDADKCALPLDLKKGLVARQQLEIHPLVRRLEDVKTSAARLAPLSGSSGAGTPQKADATYALAKASEQSLRHLVVESVREFASQLVTFGDDVLDDTSALLTASQPPPQQQQQQPAAPVRALSRSFLSRSNTDPAMSFHRSESAAAGALNGAEPALRRRSSFAGGAAAAAAAGNRSPANAGVYAVDGVHLREVMRDSGINMRFLPLVFASLDSARQPGTALLVASEIVARLAKTLFRFRLFNDARVGTSHWQTRKHRLISFIDSIMHGVFHDDLPAPCAIHECVGDQFWTVDAPLWLALGPFASSAALDDSARLDAGAAVARYRQIIRANPSPLFRALLHAFDAQLADGALPALHERRFVSMAFLRAESDLVLAGDADDPKLALQLQPTLLWSNVQFFRQQFSDLKRAVRATGGAAPRTSVTTADSFPDAGSHRAFFAAITAHVRTNLQLVHRLRVETAADKWEAVHATRSRLVKALRAASTDDESRGVAKEYCDEARELVYSHQTTSFPVEYHIALRCLELVSCSEEEMLTRAAEWAAISATLRFFYRPANPAQFAQSSSAHPLFSVVFFMLALGGARPATESLRVELARRQLQHAWLGVIGTVDAHCRRAVERSWTADSVTAIATKAASFEFEKTRPAVLLSNASTRSMSSSMSDDHSESSMGDTVTEPKFVKTARAMSTESMLTAAAVRQDVLWFVDSFLLPSARSGSWWMTGARFQSLAQSGVFSPRQRGRGDSAAPAPGVALSWGEPFGLSLDEEAQVATAPRGSRLAQLRARPMDSGSKVELLRFPSALRRVVHVSCGYRHTALVTDNRSLYTYGYGECGRLGHGDEESVATPTAVGFFESLIESVGASVGGIAHVACGREHTMAVLVNGDLYAFGWAEAGRLGTGDTGCCAYPTKVLALQSTPIQAAACGREHTLALTKQGEVFAFGAGFGGRLGIGSEADEEYPVRVAALDGVRIVRIDAGECHSAAVNDSGDVFTWGFGNSGALGTGSRDNSLLPTKVSGAWQDDEDESGAQATVTALACGGYHTLVATSAGKLYGWGDSAAGQLGAALVAAPDMIVLAPHEIPLAGVRTTPSSGSPPPTIREVSAGTFTSAVCLDDGRLFVWGSTAAGNGAPLQADEANVAQAVALEEFAVARVSCGAYHTVALTRGLEFASFNLEAAGSRHFHSCAMPVASPSHVSLTVTGSALSATQQRRLSFSDVVRGSDGARLLKRFLYGWAIVVILLGAGLLGLGLYLLYFQENVHIAPAFVYYVASYTGLALALLSGLGLFGLQQQRRCVTDGSRNYALGTFVLLSGAGSAVMVMGGIVALTLLGVVTRAERNDFAPQKVRYFETAVVTNLHAYVRQDSGGWRGIQHSLYCCGYASASALAASSPVPWDQALLDMLATVNGVAGKYCAKKASECVAGAELPCPSPGRVWCRPTLYALMRENYKLIGVFALVVGAAQFVSSVFSLFTLLCDDCWVSLNHRVLDLSELITSDQGMLTRPLVLHAGEDISHWFDPKTGDVKQHVDPERNIVLPYLPHGRFLHVAPLEPSGSWRTSGFVPWWKDPKYAIGKLTAKARWVEVVNVLTQQRHSLEVCCEETIEEIQARYLEMNSHAASYTWKCLDDGEFVPLQMKRTLEENGIVDESPTFERFDMDEQRYKPILHLYFNDDLTVL